jgi:hypothetical protein
MTHVYKSNLGRMPPGAYYVREKDAYAYSELRLSPEAAALVPARLLTSRNNTVGWKAIIQQLEDQLAARVGEPEEAAAQAAGLVEFAERVLKTSYATTPMRSTCRRAQLNNEDEEEETLVFKDADGRVLLQQSEDSLGCLRKELGVCASNARYVTLHGGVGALGDDYVRLKKDLKELAQGLSTAALQAKDTQDKACQARAEAAAMGNELNQLRHLRGPHIMAGLLRELQDVKADRGTLKDTVLALATTVAGLMEAGVEGPQSGPTNADFNARLMAHATAITGHLDLIHQEMKGGGIMVGGVMFTGQESDMDWARIHLLPNTYQCIGE